MGAGYFYVKAHVNILALLAGLVVYVLFAVPFGLAVLGVGFAPEPQKTIGSYLILLAPLIPSGFVAAYLARTRPVLMAVAVAVIAVLVFWALAPGPMPWFLVEEHSAIAIGAQAAYQGLLYIGIASAAGWCALAMKRRRRT
ncbi:MAG: hypothetical protein JWQ07_3103 [Ramlibacter sp.]|nr:hypothetical protein [Ramlibacter sp.]